MAHAAAHDPVPRCEHRFLFATGIEGSSPRVRDPDGRMRRVDEMERCGHYQRWREDFALVRDLGLEFLRYGPPYHLTNPGPDRYDWSFPDETFGELRRLGIEPIADLCHFGVPDWIGDFQNPDWPTHFASYAGAFARRYPWVRYYTPVNEIFVAATFSAEYGWWNEGLASERAFVTAVKHLVSATLRAEEAILRVQPAALFVQSESTEYFHPEEPAATPRAEFLDEKRFLALDLSYGHDVRGTIYDWLLEHGLRQDEYRWFQRHGRGLKPFCILGNDYYLTNEHLVPAGHAPVRPSGELLGYYVLTRQYWDRYRLPVMHTETNLPDDTGGAVHWLHKQWATMLQLKRDGVPIVGFTWYSLTDQVDWDSALREDAHHVNPLGLVDLDRRLRPVGEAYRDLVARWRDILPVEGHCLCPLCGSRVASVDAVARHHRT